MVARFGGSPFKGGHELCDDCDGTGITKDWDEWATTCGRCGGWGYVPIRDDDDGWDPDENTFVLKHNNPLFDVPEPLS